MNILQHIGTDRGAVILMQSTDVVNLKMHVAEYVYILYYVSSFMLCILVGVRMLDVTINCCLHLQYMYLLAVSPMRNPNIGSIRSEELLMSEVDLDDV